MRADQRVVTSTPLTELWDENGPVEAARERDLGFEEVRSLLRGGPLRFVIADPGLPLRWLAPDECFVFWAGTLRDHLCSRERIDRDAYADGYCFLAAEWRLSSDECVIVLERVH